MTVHQSKGLEFEIVVAPELTGSLMMVPAAAAGSRAPAAAPENVCVWTDKGIRHLLPKRLRDAFEQTTGNGVRGSLCLLYVTMTRAIHALHLLVPPTTKTTQKTLAGILAAAFSDQEKLEEDAQVWTTGDAAWHQHVSGTQQPHSPVTVVRRKVTPFVPLAAMPDGRHRSLSRRAPSEHTALRLPFRPRSSTADGYSKASPAVSPRARGTLFHAWFEQIRWLDEGGQPTAEQLRTITQHRSIRDLRIPEKAFEALMNEFLTMLTQSETQQALSQSAALKRFAKRLKLKDLSELSLRVESERPFVYRDQGHIVQGTIDRLVIAEHSGKTQAVEIIDYKTDGLSGDVAEWIASKKQHYADQLRDYRTAVTRYYGIPIASTVASLMLLEANTCFEVP